MKDTQNLSQLFNFNFHPVVKGNPNQDFGAINLSPDNPEIIPSLTANTKLFDEYLKNIIQQKQVKYLIGGYAERREIYRRSELFDINQDGSSANNEEPRNLHLGIDIWGNEGTEIYSPADGLIHSFAFNNHFGDYGATIILQHQINDFSFYTLYGHLSLADLENIKLGQKINRGELLAHFGSPSENGDWPPHLHFQLILEIGTWKGDYPGVCKSSESEYYLKNSPNADFVLNLNSSLKN